MSGKKKNPGKKGTEVKQLNEEQVKQLLYFEDGTTLRMQFFNPVPVRRKKNDVNPQKGKVLGFDPNKKELNFSGDFTNFLAGQKNIPVELKVDIIQKAKQLRETVRGEGGNTKAINKVKKMQEDNQELGNNRKYDGEYETNALSIFNDPNIKSQSVNMSKETKMIKNLFTMPLVTNASPGDDETKEDEPSVEKEQDKDQQEVQSVLEDLLNNVKKISQKNSATEQQEEKEKVRVVVKEQSSDITDPTSGENNFDNVQLAVTDFKNKTGQGIHTDELMKNVKTPTPSTGSLSSSDPFQDISASEGSSYASDATVSINLDTSTDEDADNEGDDTDDEFVLRGQVQQQRLGGRQRFRRRPQQPPVPPRRPEEALENTRYGDLTIPQEVERDAGSAEQGDGRLGISQAPVPQMDIETETLSRNKKTIQQLRMECKCFKQIYKDKIKTKRFKTLVNIDLERKSLDDVRLIHKHFTEEVRDYYNSHRGLRVGVIVDPAILGLNVQALQGMIAPRVPSYAPAVDAGRMAEGFQQVGGELRRGPQTGQTPALADTDVHYKLGGVRHATGKYDRDIESLNNHIDREEDKKKSNFGRGSTRFNQAKTFKNSFYQAPSHTNIPTIRLKTK